MAVRIRAKQERVVGSHDASNHCARHNNSNPRNLDGTHEPFRAVARKKPTEYVSSMTKCVGAAASAGALEGSKLRSLRNSGSPAPVTLLTWKMGQSFSDRKFMAHTTTSSSFEIMRGILRQPGDLRMRVNS